MATKVSNFSDLIQRVTASCLLHPLAATRHADDVSDRQGGTDSDEDNYKTEDEEEKEDEDEEEELTNWEGKNKNDRSAVRTERVMEMEMLLGEVFEAVSAMKRAYVSLQEAHCPWDPDRMRVADVAVVAELRRLGVLRERFRRNIGGGGRGRRKVAAATLREVVAPYEATVEELKREVKAKEVELDSLREKLQTAASLSSSGSGGKKGKSKKKVSCISQGQDPIPHLCHFSHLN